MNVNKILSTLVVAGLLTACGGADESPAPSVDEIGLPEVSPTPTPAPTSASKSTEFPLVETFTVNGTTKDFFSKAHKELLGDFDSDYDQFYYSTSGIYAEDGVSLNPSSGTWTTNDGDGKLRIGDARFTLAQTNPDLKPDVADERNKSTAGATATWGEMDLSKSFTVSFCVVEASGSSDFELYIDNNDSTKANSIHGNSSRLVKLGLAGLQGDGAKRLTINIPGDVTFGDGNKTTIPSQAVDAVLAKASTSFLQLRVSKGGYLVMDDLVVGYQGDETTAKIAELDDCTLKSTDYGADGTNPWVDATPTPDPTPTPTPTPTVVGSNILTEDFSASDATAFFDAAYKSIPGDSTKPMYLATSGASRVTVDGAALTMTNARFTVGSTDNSVDTAATDTTVNGSLNLSGNYKIRFKVTAFTDADSTDDPGKFQVYVDNNTSGSANSTHGGASKVIEYAVGDSEVASLPATIEVTPTIGTATSFIQIRADSRVGLLTIDDLEIIDLDATPAPTPTPTPGDSVLTEEFTASDASTFFSAAYKSAPTDSSVPLYAATSGSSRITVDGTQLTMANARFTVGSLDNSANTAETDTVSKGSLDLSKSYTIRFKLVAFTDADATDDPGKFQVYVDNNTSSSSASMHGGASKVIEYAVGAAEVSTLPAVIEVSPSIGTAASFIQIRADSRVGSLVIDDLEVVYK